MDKFTNKANDILKNLNERLIYVSGNDFDLEGDYDEPLKVRGDVPPNMCDICGGTNGKHADWCPDNPDVDDEEPVKKKEEEAEEISTKPNNPNNPNNPSIEKIKQAAAAAQALGAQSISPAKLNAAYTGAMDAVAKRLQVISQQLQ